MSQWIIWLIIVILLALIELATINLTTIWFVASGIIALISSIFIKNYIIQFGIFVILGIILLITTRPVLTKLLKTHNEKTNLDRVIGMIGIVTQAITKDKTGEVKVDGKKWTAYADSSIKKNTKVKILEINGVKLKVEKEKK
jgi:membrane protein implicated in regulation of membrane protease activity